MIARTQLLIACARVLERVAVDANGCWCFTGAKDWRGYGVIKVAKCTRKTHRIVFEVLEGPIPQGLEMDHLCRKEACCRPDHLEPVTHAENVRRGICGQVNAARQLGLTHCKRGHAFDEANTYWENPRKRKCRTCAAARALAAYHRKRHVSSDLLAGR